MSVLCQIHEHKMTGRLRFDDKLVATLHVSHLIILKNATADLHIKISRTNEENVKVVAV
jgi:hypothetical protein